MTGVQTCALPISGRDASPSQVTSPQLVRFSQQFAGTHLYTWVERGTVRVKCLAQEHNTMSPARARTRTARSRVERANHEATAPPTILQRDNRFLQLDYLKLTEIARRAKRLSINILPLFRILKFSNYCRFPIEFELAGMK